ncbi:hypothetical protein RW64_08530 [Geobacter sulfurreducens]|nr:hypothetical protein RW64_08530 [Geobacter sulfurreducens]
MKKMISLMAIVSLSLVSLPAFAQASVEQKNDRLPYGKNCPGTIDSLPERISRLEKEIAKGERIYTPEELKKLDRKLTDANFLLRSILKGGGGE